MVAGNLNTVTNILTANISAQGTYALLGQALHRVYLPMLKR
jgi:hypothetical protein